jgi:hypothetical protein
MPIMFKPKFVALIAASVLLSAAAMAVNPAAPTAASSPAPDYGAVVKCKFRTTESGYWGFTAPMKRIVVSPPQMFATSGRQTVGWRFVVKRLLDEGANPAWSVTYMSPIQKRLASSSQAADFDTMRVGVAVPDGFGGFLEPDVSYTVTLKMFRYRTDGSLKSKTSYLMPNYYQYLDGDLWDQPSWGGTDYCPGVVWASVSGPH